MQTVTRSRQFPYKPEIIYELITTPNKLAQIVKRLESITVLEREGETGRVLAVLDLPGGKSVETEGHVVGDYGKQVRFSTAEPFPLEITWELKAHGDDSTQVNYTIAVDFSPVLAFLSAIVLKGYLSAEMERDIDRLHELLAL